MRKKGTLGVTTVEGTLYGMLRRASLSVQLHSGALSGPSLSHLMSLLKPRPPSETTPSQPPDCNCDPRAPPGPVPPFTRDPVPYSLCLYTPPSTAHTQTHPRGPQWPWGGDGGDGGVTLLTPEWKNHSGDKSRAISLK